MSASTLNRRYPPDIRTTADPLAKLAGRRVRVSAWAEPGGELPEAPLGIVTQILDLGFASLVRVRAEGIDLVGDFTPDELELVE